MPSFMSNDVYRGLLDQVSYCEVFEFSGIKKEKMVMHAYFTV